MTPESVPLSIILCSRNDSYMGNSRWRLETTLNYLAARLVELGRRRQVEVLVADWGSEVPLHTALDLTPAAAQLVSFLPVPPDVARRHEGDSPFPEVLALNAAARRSRGEYIGRIDQDTLVGARFLDTFFAWYEGRQQPAFQLRDSLLFANRRGIPYRFAVRCPALWRVEQFVTHFGSSLQIFSFADVFWTSYVGIWLAHRDAWFACRGYDERLLYMNGMEVDMILRLRPTYEIVDLGALVDVDFYHLDHYATETAYAGDHRKVNRDIDIDAPPPDLVVNGPDWGLGEYSLPVVGYEPAEPRSQPAARPADSSLGRAAMELAYVGAQLGWDKRARPVKLGRFLGRAAGFAWGKRGAVSTLVADKATREYKRLEWALSSSPKGRRVRAVQAEKADRRAAGDSYTDTPRVAVVVQSFNQGWNVKRLERRLRATGMDELIVCEDGSLDGAPAKWAKRLTRPNDFLIRSNDLHEIRAFDRAIGYTRAELVCLMQDDDQPPRHGGWLARAVALFDDHPRLAVLGGCWGFDSYFDQVYNSPRSWSSPRRVEIPYRDPHSQVPMMFVENVNVGPYLLRSSVYRELGGFDVSYSAPGDPGICFDSDYCYRVWRAGYQVALIDVPVKNPYYARGGTFRWGRDERDRNEARNKERLIELYDAHMPEIQQRVRESNARLIDR